MAFPYVLVFGVLLLGYMGFSVWERLDPRYPIGAALVLLVATALAQLLGALATADTLAEYVFLLLIAGVVLLLIDQVRPRRRGTGNPAPLGRETTDPEEQSTDPTHQRQGPPQ
jgi:hypothetical protein